MKNLIDDEQNLETQIYCGNFFDSKTRKLDDILHNKLEEAFQSQISQLNYHDISKIALDYSPIDLAYAVIHLPISFRCVVYDNLPNRDSKIKFILNTDSETRLMIFRYMQEIEVKKLFDKMPTDEIVRIMEDMSERRFRRTLELIDIKKAMKIKELKKHHRNSAGRLMTSDFFSFNMNITIKQVSCFIRDYPRIDFTRGIYVLNHKKELIGYVPGRNLMINNVNTTLRQIMRPVLHKVTTETTREEVVDIVERYKLSFLPVVDSNNNIVGVIANEDVIEAMEDLADERIARIGGTVEKVSLTEPIFQRFLARSPWLFVTLIAGLVNVGVMSAFQSQAGGILTFVLFFVPLITGMSGNIGIQCSTVLVRSMAIGSLSISNKKEAILKEFSIGMFSGIIFGLGVGLVVYFLGILFVTDIVFSPLALGLIVSLGLIGACFAGTFLGVLSPLFFVKIGIDPAIAAGPIVTAFNDFFSMSIYFVIASGLSMLFL
jgi:magnesium transporter